MRTLLIAPTVYANPGLIGLGEVWRKDRGILRQAIGEATAVEEPILLVRRELQRGPDLDLH